jgi:hypothetical protein
VSRENLRQQIHVDLERQFQRSYQFGLATISLYYAALVPYYMATYEAPVRLPIVASTAGASLMLMCCLAVLHSRRLQPRHFQLLAVVSIAIIAAPLLLQVALGGHPRHQLELGLIIVVDALVFHDTVYFLAAQATVGGAWTAVILHLPPPPGGRVDYGLGIFSAFIVSFTAYLILQGILKNQAELRLADLVREEEKDALHRELAEAFERVRTLRGLVPICAHCKKIRDDTGFWQKVETYVESHSHAEFTHGLCPECLEALKDQFEAVVPPEDPPCSMPI